MEAQSADKSLVIIAFTGSVAAVRAEKILSLFTKTYKVLAIFSRSAEEFVNREKLSKQYQSLIWESSFEADFATCKKWTQEAAALIVAPVSANTLGKFVTGICDSTITMMWRMWDRKKPAFLAPAMNTMMYLHPITSEYIFKMEKTEGVNIIPPISKKLACGDLGIGGIADSEVIYDTVFKFVPIP